MESLQVALSQDFFEAFARIPRNKQKKVNEFVGKFRNNPQSSGLNYEKINDAANDQFRSVRVDQDYRAIVMKPSKGNVYLLLWVDKHDEAYAWARRHKCQVNPETGALQLYEVTHHEAAVETEAASEPAEDKAESEGEALFDLRDRELLRLGVPEDRLEQVKAVTSQRALDQMERLLPVEAFEALCFLAEGVSLNEVMAEYAVPDGEHEVDTTDIDAALELATTQRRFHVVEDEAELQQMLEAPLEQWRVFLHPLQRQLVERHWNGPVRVLGGAGTGKTVVAMHRARWLARNVLAQGEKLLFTTFTRNLAMDIEANLRKICTQEEMGAIEVTNINGLAHRALRQIGHPGQVVYPGSDEYSKCWDKALTQSPGELNFPDSFYEEEFEQVVLTQRVQTRQEYFKAKRVGRGVALSRKQRAQIWPVFEEMRLQLHQNGFLTLQDGIYAVMDHLAEGKGDLPQYRCAVVDETQDFGPEMLQLLRALVPEQKDDMMLVGDGHQRIYGRRASLGQCGINIRGRGKKLRVNYRTTEEIRRYATAVLEGIEVDDLDDDQDSLSGYRSLLMGQKPVLKGFSDPKEEAEWVCSEIQKLTDDGMPDRNICVVARTEKHLKDVKSALKEAGRDAYPVRRDSTENTQIPGIRLANMHRVKGLEFKVVFIVAVNQGVVPLQVAMDKTEDVVEKRARDLNERALLHVACTRAVQGLYVSWSGEVSEYLRS
ncbi:MULTISPECIES: UvrD-helicase domain-containing protein [Halomonadaceae]|uniref:DNA 3'-5' helicase n=1 Tax=Vreelandella halophila TaxID=86177 RepID=A0A9X5B7H4_9GAMM|nr:MULTISPECIES: UvrD-helicase domain-containing protein [Halomonas]MYL28152.1 AAA family ATPase [Halomonas utahensis]MYL76059.1 AAA family ATPase [Halomonas sp. 22501_18_FS]